ncbi:hypothetical protein QUF58_09455 [Anaerolineales bacterium HSG24]|nr:hypothetical protein [Anaerolineales bacterium HSG24]
MVTYQETITELAANNQKVVTVPLSVGSDVPVRARLSASVQGGGDSGVGVAQTESSTAGVVSHAVYLPVLLHNQ